MERRVTGSARAALANQLFSAVLQDVLLQDRTQPSPDTEAGYQATQIIRRAALRIAKDPTLDLDIQRLAREFGYSRRHFTSLFREVMGVPPKRYLLRCRLNQALELLQDLELSIKEIALELGFQSQRYFSSWFHAEMGMSPSQWREAYYHRRA